MGYKSTAAEKQEWFLALIKTVRLNLSRILKTKYLVRNALKSTCN